MGMFQAIANKIKAFRWPWLSNVLRWLQDTIIEISFEVGKQVIAEMEAKIIEVATKNISWEEKWQTVYDYAKKTLKVSISDRWINLLIEVLVNRLKDERAIK